MMRPEVYVRYLYVKKTLHKLDTCLSIATKAIISILLINYSFHWKRKWQPTPVFLPRESQRWGIPVGCHLWGRTESDRTEAT